MTALGSETLPVRPAAPPALPVPSGIDWSASIAEALATARAHGVELSLMEALHLATLREAVRRGELTEHLLSPNDPHLVFARWLVQEGHLSG